MDKRTEIATAIMATLIHMKDMGGVVAKLHQGAAMLDDNGRVRLEARVSPEVRDWITLEASMRGVTISEVVEVALRKTIKATDYQRRMQAALYHVTDVEAFVNRHELASKCDAFAGLRTGVA